MPYINIKEEDIVVSSSFDSIENAVLIFGFDYRKGFDAVEKDEYEPYKLFTSLKEFVTYFRSINPNFNIAGSSLAVHRPYVTAYDCLANSLPVIYIFMDEYANNEDLGFDPVIHLDATTEGTPVREEAIDYIEYDWLSNEDAIPEMPASDIDFDDFNATYWGRHGFYYNEKNDASIGGFEDVDGIEDVINRYKAGTKYAAQIALQKLIADLPNTQIELEDRLNFPITFVTTCGYEDAIGVDDDGNPDTESVGIFNYQPVLASNLGGRLDVIYLYDLPSSKVCTPEYISSTLQLSLADPTETVNIVYPWGHYNTYSGIQAAHMPGSYGYLMAYARSIKNNKPWLAAAGVNRGVIPNILDVDYRVRESHVHNWQADEKATSTKNFMVNPIIDLGSNYGKVIFGNRTSWNGTNADALTFKSFLNVRILLAYIHKQAFNSSMQHMFEPNDDIVWLSFKQKVNKLLDEMVSGRGLKWYKWTKLVPEGNHLLGQLKARLTIRPIEAIESFDITISMTDEDIEVSEGE